MTSADTVPAALGKLSEKDRESLRTFVINLLQEFGELGDSDFEELSRTYGFEKKDSLEVVAHIKEDDSFVTLDLADRFIVINKQKYELFNILGSGKYAQVRRGRNDNTKKSYALKFLFIDGDRIEIRQLRNQMRDELRVFKRVKHRNIVRLHAFHCRSALRYKGKDKPRPCMIQVQELCSKGELYDYVQYTGRLSEKLTRTLFLQFASGLKACHDAGIAHRDLKPDNILLDADYNIKICDFGFSKSFMRPVEGGARRAKLKTILGTSGYMSPEMLLKMPYTEKTDIFSAGVILFILLAGYPPLQSAEIGDWWFERLLEGRYHKFWQAHAQGGGKFSNTAKKLIVQMLEPSPKERLSVAEVLNSDWIKEESFGKDEYRQIMKTMKEKVDQKRAEIRNNTTTRNTELDAVKRFVEERKAEGWKPSLRGLVENRYRRSLCAVRTEDELMSALNTIENVIPGRPELRRNLKVVDPVEAAKMLVDSRDLMELQKVVDVGVDTGLEFIRTLQPLTKTVVDGHILGMECKVHDRFFKLENCKLPSFDPEVDNLPLNSFRLRCGFDILCFALRYVTKAKFKGGRMNPCTGTRPGVVQLQFQLERQKHLLTVEPTAMSADERKRREALGLPMEPTQTTGGTVQSLNYLFNMEIKCFEDSTQKGCMLVAFRRVNTSYDSPEDMVNIVEATMYGTCLSAFLEMDEPLPSTNHGS